jgi:hypothetical protein
LDVDDFALQENLSDPFKTADRVGSDACRNDVTVLTHKLLQFEELAMNNVHLFISEDLHI